MGLWGDLVDAAEDGADAVVDEVGDAIKAGVDAVEDVADAIGEVAEETVDALGELAEDALEALGEFAEDALDGAGDIYDAFADLAEAALEGAVDLVEDGWNALADGAEDAWESIEDAAEDAWESIEEAVEDGWDSIADAVEDVWDGAQAAVETAVDAAADAAEFAATAAASAYENALDAVERTLTWLGDLIKDVAYAIAMLGACLAGILVHTLAEYDNILINFWKLPRRLSPTMQAEAASILPGIPLDRVYYIEDANLSANHFSHNADAMTFSHVELAGVNFAYMIYVDDGIDDTIEEDRALLVHELVHVDQYRRFRFEDAFACAYGIGFVSAGFSYEENPLEAEAFAIEGVYRASA